MSHRSRDHDRRGTGVGVGGRVGAERTALGLLSRVSVNPGEDRIENGQFCLFDR